MFAVQQYLVASSNLLESRLSLMFTNAAVYSSNLNSAVTFGLPQHLALAMGPRRLLSFTLAIAATAAVSPGLLRKIDHFEREWQQLRNTPTNDNYDEVHMRIKTLHDLNEQLDAAVSEHHYELQREPSDTSNFNDVSTFQRVNRIARGINADTRFHNNRLRNILHQAAQHSTPASSSSNPTFHPNVSDPTRLTKTHPFWHGFPVAKGWTALTDETNGTVS